MSFGTVPGSLLFPTHVANLPRRLRIGKFDKNVWGLYGDFSFAVTAHPVSMRPAAAASG
jgi:hypothetical protein